MLPRSTAERQTRSFKKDGEKSHSHGKNFRQTLCFVASSAEGTPSKTFSAGEINPLAANILCRLQHWHRNERIGRSRERPKNQ
jgi:hypothetical protein